MGSVYSQQLLALSLKEASIGLAVPEGFVYVVRDVSAVFQTSVVCDLLGTITDPEDVQYGWLYASGGGLASGFHWEGRVVIPAGWSYGLSTFDVIGGVSAVLSGYVLSEL